MKNKNLLDLFAPKAVAAESLDLIKLGMDYDQLITTLSNQFRSVSKEDSTTRFRVDGNFFAAREATRVVLGDKATASHYLKNGCDLILSSVDTNFIELQAEERIILGYWETDAVSEALGIKLKDLISDIIVYSNMIYLDAEDLAEQGIKEEYEKLMPVIQKYIETPEEIHERIDNDLPSYTVSALEKTYEIDGPQLSERPGEGWGRATFAFFDIVNNQLKNTNVKFYAINGGNDLFGVFLTEQAFEKAKACLENKSDWPYIPVLEYPWYGQHH